MDHMINCDAGALPRMAFGARGKEGGVELINGFLVDTSPASYKKVMLSKRPEERIISAEKVTAIFRRVAYMDRLPLQERGACAVNGCNRKWTSDGDWECGVSSVLTRADSPLDVRGKSEISPEHL